MASQPPYEPTSRPVLQFSLTALFVLTTVFALALSAFFAIGQFLGVSPLELLTIGLTRFIFSVPRVIVLSVGLAMAFRRMDTYRRPAILTAIALTGFLVVILLMQIIQITVIAGMSSGQFSSVSISWIFGVMSLVSALVDVVCWILILMAIFTDRQVTRPPIGTQPDIVDPFSQDEPVTATAIDEE